jgi:hypothetical protein
MNISYVRKYVRASNPGGQQQINNAATMSSSSSDSDDEASSSGNNNNNVKVYCRLRPMNKLEVSKRSKNCVDLPDDEPGCLVVDSPLEGEYDFFFDGVFEEYASQEEVYQGAIASVPTKLLEGYNCTVVAYGQTGSGKSHTMMGLNGGVDGLSALTQQQQQESEEMNGKPPRKVNPEAQGMILKTTHDLFQKIQQASPSLEFTIRCSYVELYLEKILDLLNPGGGQHLSIVETTCGGDEAAGNDVSTSVQIAGAAQLCCLNEADVYGLLARGNARRTMSSTEMNTDSSRSHAIFILRVEQHDTKTGLITTSELHMCDLAGSEMANSSTSAVAQRGDASAVQMEAQMINKSLTALQNCIRAQLETQQGGASKHSLAGMSKHSKLTRFLRPSFGGNCLTWLLLTASPSSYNIGETISTIKFGQRVGHIQNPAVINTDYSREVYRKRLKKSEEIRKGQMAILRAVAQECKELKEKDGSFDEDEHDGALWDTIEKLLASADEEELDFKTLVRGRAADSASDSSTDNAERELDKARREIQQLREQLEYITKAREDSDNQLSELQSEVAVLRSQNEHLIADKTKDLEELINAKNELQIMSQRKIEVEHNFRTSQFRENEAIVFLRTFRRFYRNVLRDRAAHGSGSIKAIAKELSDKVPGALDLSELVDADKLLLEAGLIEEHEMRDEKSAPVYVPSKDALIRSATAAKKAAKEMGALEKEMGALKKLESEAADRRAALERQGSALSASAQSAPAAPGRSAFNRRGSAIRRSSFASLEQAIVEEDADTNGDGVDTKEEPITDDNSKLPGAGADAGAGSSQPKGDSKGSAAAALLLWDQTGSAVTRKQQLLGTPAGRFSLMQDRNVHEELEDMADRCIRLERALKEEKATVEMLSGRAGGLNKKKLAQEAIQLRQQIEKKTQNLMAIAWKMNELNLINKSYNEKMVNREQHVVYLEENYVELQNRNRMIIEEQQEAERKLRDELNSVRKALGGMSVPLWQLNEKSPKEEHSFANRIVIPVSGGSPKIDEDPRERRLSEAESEPSVDFYEEQVVPAVEKAESSTQTDEPEIYAVQEIAKKEDIGIQTNEVPLESMGTQTDDVLHEDIGTMTEESGPAPKSVDAGVQTDVQQVDEDHLTAGNAAAAGVLGAAAGVATAAAVSSQTDEELVPDMPDKDTDPVPGSRAASGAVSGTAGTATAVPIPTQTGDESSSEESVSEHEKDVAGKLAAFDIAVDTRSGASVSSQSDDNGSEDSYESESDDETAEKESRPDRAEIMGTTSEARENQSEESDTDSEGGIGELTDTDVSNAAAATAPKAEDRSGKDLPSDDDIEALTGELAADGAVPRKISVGSNAANEDDEESTDENVVDKPPWRTGRAAAAGITGAAVVAAAASVTREAEAERGVDSESKPLVGNDQKSIDAAPGGKGDTFKAKNIFASTVMSVLNMGGNDAAKNEEDKPEETEIESYHGTGHSPTNPVATEGLAASSRDEWAAARDDFDSIFEETAQAVNTASSRRRTIKEEDTEKSTREFMDIAAKIGHKDEEEIVTMGSKRQLWTPNGQTIEEARKPWEKSSSADVRKPWEKKGKDEGSLGSSFDATKDDWYGGSDEESEGSYQFETHVLKRPQKERPSEPTFVKKFSTSAAKRDASASEDEFDQMMHATQAALGVVDVSEREEENVPTNDTLSLTSKEEALFTGGRPNDFQPRRQADRPRIRAGVLKEEKRSSRDKSRSQLLRKKSESRRKVGDEKKRKKKDERRRKRVPSRRVIFLERKASDIHSHTRGEGRRILHEVLAGNRRGKEQASHQQPRRASR